MLLDSCTEFLGTSVTDAKLNVSGSVSAGSDSVVDTKSALTPPTVKVVVVDVPYSDEVVCLTLTWSPEDTVVDAPWNAPPLTLKVPLLTLMVLAAFMPEIVTLLDVAVLARARSL